MIEAGQNRHTTIKPNRVSYLFMAAALAVMAWLHLATPLLAALFSYLALTRLHLVKERGKWLAVGLFLLLLVFVTYELGYSSTRPCGHCRR